MTFLSVVARGLMRRPIRTGLTLLGIAIGSAAVVALVGTSRGFIASWMTGVKSRGADIVVVSMHGSIMPKSFPASARDRIARLPGVAATDPVLLEFLSIEDSELLVVSAREWGGPGWKNLRLLSGRMPRDASERAVVLGKITAEVLAKKSGDPIQIETAELTVVGIVEGDAFSDSGSVILSLPLLQELTDNEGKISAIGVRVAPGTTETEMRKLCGEIDRLVPEARSRIAEEQIRNGQGWRLLHAASWSTSLLAVLVGVFGVMNTMLMSVFERKQEICLLLALGWRRGRIVRLVLFESAMLGLLGGIVGVLLGIAAVRVIKTAPIIRGLLEPELSASLMIGAVAIAVVVGIISGVYPAWRSSRLTPSLGLQA